MFYTNFIFIYFASFLFSDIFSTPVFGGIPVGFLKMILNLVGLLLALKIFMAKKSHRMRDLILVGIISYPLFVLLYVQAIEGTSSVLSIYTLLQMSPLFFLFPILAKIFEDKNTVSTLMSRLMFLYLIFFSLSIINAFFPIGEITGVDRSKIYTHLDIVGWSPMYSSNTYFQITIPFFLVYSFLISAGLLSKKWIRIFYLLFFVASILSNSRAAILLTLVLALYFFPQLVLGTIFVKGKVMAQLLSVRNLAFALGFSLVFSVIVITLFDNLAMTSRLSALTSTNEIFDDGRDISAAVRVNTWIYLIDSFTEWFLPFGNGLGATNFQAARNFGANYSFHYESGLYSLLYETGLWILIVFLAFSIMSFRSNSSIARLCLMLIIINCAVAPINGSWFFWITIAFVFSFIRLDLSHVLIKGYLKVSQIPSNSKLG